MTNVPLALGSWLLKTVQRSLCFFFQMSYSNFFNIKFVHSFCKAHLDDLFATFLTSYIFCLNALHKAMNCKIYGSSYNVPFLTTPKSFGESFSVCKDSFLKKILLIISLSLSFHTSTATTLLQGPNCSSANCRIVIASPLSYSTYLLSK